MRSLTISSDSPSVRPATRLAGVLAAGQRLTLPLETAAAPEV
ncbi:MAG: hypothetical protein U0792_21310 [Gemmataceae bacterium]